MFDHTHYVPILRWKAGEKRALKALSHRDKARMTPILEWSRTDDVSPEEDRAVRMPTPRELTKDVLDNWGARPFFYDARRFWSDHLAGDSTELRRYAAEIANGGLRAIPVFTLDDGEAYRRALASLTSKDGVCVRLGFADIAGATMQERLAEFLKATGHDPSSVHLIADFETHFRDMDIPAFCSRFQAIRNYCTFTVAAGSFPLDLREFKGPQIFYLAREEWVRWHDQVNRDLLRRPTFGDYATLNPQLSPVKKGLNPSATIRYTTEDYWLVMKGEGLRNRDGPRHEQYPANASLLMKRPDYCGPAFSEGDRYIQDVAARSDGPGNPTTWVQAGVNHHVTFVIRQLAALVDATAKGASTSKSRKGVRREGASGSLGIDGEMNEL